MEFGYGIPGTAPDEIVVALGDALEKAKLDSFWVNYYRYTPVDGLAQLVVGTQATSTIDVGVGVVPLNIRSAEEIVEFAKNQTVDTSRWLMGLGAGNVIQGSLDRVRSAVNEVRKGVGCKVVVAALGEKMCRLAGEIADGVLFNWVTPESARQCAEWVRSGAEDVGRSCPTRYSYMRFAVGEGREERIENESSRYFQTHKEHFAKMGATPFDASISVADGKELIERTKAWQDSLDVMVLRPLPPEQTVAAHLELFDAIGIDGQQRR